MSRNAPPFGGALRDIQKTPAREIRGAIHSTKVPTGPTGESGPPAGPPQKVDLFFRNFSGWTEPIHWVLDRNFRKFWLNGSRPRILIRLLNHRVGYFKDSLTWVDVKKNQRTFSFVCKGFFQEDKQLF